MSRYVRGVLLPSSSAPLLTVRQAVYSIWGGLGLLMATVLLMRLLVLPMSVEQSVTLRLAAGGLVAVGATFAVAMVAAGVRNRIVQVYNEMVEAAVAAGLLEVVEVPQDEDEGD